MRERKIREANVLIGLAAMAFAYGVFEYARAVAIGGRPSPIGLPLALLAGTALLCFDVMLVYRFYRVRFKGSPWIYWEDRGTSWAWWTSVAIGVAWLGDAGLRLYQWATGMEWVSLPEFWMPLFAWSSYYWVEKFVMYRRWLRSLA